MSLVSATISFLVSETLLQETEEEVPRDPNERTLQCPSIAFKEASVCCPCLHTRNLILWAEERNEADFVCYLLGGPSFADSHSARALPILSATNLTVAIWR